MNAAAGLRSVWRPVLEALADAASCQSSQQCRSMGQLALRTGTIKAGSSGRQGVSGVTATVFGATGFLGRYVVAAIGEKGGRVVCPHRCDDMDMQHLRPMGDLGNIITLQDFSIRDDDLVRQCISKSNVVINLIGQNTETWNYGFDEVHAKWPQKLAQMCSDTPSVDRLIQVSCLGAEIDSASSRMASKARGDAAVMEAFPDATLLRCGPVVGNEDRFYNDMALWRYSNNGVPVVDGGTNMVQPVFVVDIAEAIYKTLEIEGAKGATYELAGPEALSMRDMARTVCSELREDYKLAQITSFFAVPMAKLRERMSGMLPMHMMTRDLVYTSSFLAEGFIDKIVSPGAKTFEDLDLKPHSTMSGVAIDHIRHWRKGGYNAGTNEPLQAAAP